MSIEIILCSSSVVRIVLCIQFISLSNGTNHCRSDVFRIVSTGTILYSRDVVIIVLRGAVHYCSDAVINMCSGTIICGIDAIKMYLMELFYIVMTPLEMSQKLFFVARFITQTSIRTSACAHIVNCCFGGIILLDTDLCSSR